MDKSINKRVCVVESIDGKSTRKAKLYCINNGKTTDIKISKQLFMSTPIEKGDIIYLGRFDKKPKAIPLEKDENGKVLKWGKDDTNMENWLVDYSMVN